MIGVDFDNTIAKYDALMHAIAVERGLISPSAGKAKREIRDRIRSLPEGEIEWQKLQAIAYGPKIGEAEPTEGVLDFFRRCRTHDVPVYVVSHKTRYANHDDTGTDLREAALGWMEMVGLFDDTGAGLAPGAVYFESTRQEKIDRVRALGCTHFIDDLEETFLEDSFPQGVERILFSPNAEQTEVKGVTRLASWEEIGDYLFGRDA